MVHYDVPLIPQTSSMSCWSASIAMIRAWNDRASYDPRRIAENAGGANYMPQFVNGLSPSDTYILRRNGFELLPLRGHTAEGWQTLVVQHGPLWVATAAPKPHVRVVLGLVEGWVYINDPAPVNSGSQYRRPFSNFVSQLETLVRSERAERAPVYVAYLR